MKPIFRRRSATEGFDAPLPEPRRPFDDLVSAVRSQTESIVQMCQAFEQENQGDAELALEIELRFTESLGFLRQLEDTSYTPERRSALISGAKDAMHHIAGVSDTILSEDVLQEDEDDEAKIISLVLSGANESLTDGRTMKDTVLYWLSADPDVAMRFVNAFSDKGAYLTDSGNILADQVSEAEIEGWIYDQEDLASMYEAEFGDQGEEWMVLAKEDENPDSEEGFLEYRYVDELQAKGSFFNLEKPAALLKRDEMTWKIITMNPGAARLIDMLEEQVELLNA